MKHLIIGDVHGYHRILRKFLTEQGVIDKKGNRINRDEFKVYCTGDLCDGNINRQGDLLNMEYAAEWFDAVCLGNHEYGFMGGKHYSGKRKHDRKFLSKLLDLVDAGVYVPAILIPGGDYGDFLAVHGGFSEHFGFDTAQDAYEYIKVMWDIAPSLNEEIAIFDWQGAARAGSTYYCDPTGGIFELDWAEDRNTKFNQIVGHTHHYEGPIMKEYEEHGTYHWNVDVGGKQGKGVGGVIVDDVESSVTPVFYGERYTSYKSTTSTYKNVPVYSSPNKDRASKDPKVTIKETWKNGKSTAEIILSDASTKLLETRETKELNESKAAELLWKELDISDLDQTVVEILDDPDVLEVYLEETRRGQIERFND